MPTSNTPLGLHPLDADLLRGHGPHAGSPIPYRRDIDGLRALAVLPILFSHVGVRGFGGGYIGVDIFFVISGYLITGILMRDIEAKRHSIREFYRRRVLRIFPALMVMLAVVTALAAITMLPGELLRCARSLGGSALFASNLIFYFEAGYFDAASLTKPLLHTWSLAIEEQFYLLWPLLLMVVGPRRIGRARIAIGAISLVSLAAALAMVRTDMSAAFYLLPARAWELGMGGLLAVTPLRPGPRLVREALAALALATIGLCSWRYSNLTPFPGLAALPPCAAAALLIATGPDTLVGRVLALWPAMFIGQISYSLYLWHWPVVTFAKSWLLLPSTMPVMAGEIALSLALAILSWRFVETPVRVRGRQWRTGAVLGWGLAAMIASLACAGALLASHGLPGRFTPAQAALARYNDGDYEASYRRGTCFIEGPLDEIAPACIRPANDRRPKLLLVGDSMAADLWPGLSRHLDRYDILQATMIGCTPGLYRAGSRVKCERFFRSILDGLKPDGASPTLLLSGRWKFSDMAELDAMLGELARRRIDTVLLGPMPNYEAALPRLLVFADRDHDPGVVKRSLSSGEFAIDATMRDLAARHGIRYVSPLSMLCHGRDCRTLAAPGVPLQFDASHMTPEGSAVVVDMLLPEIARAIRPAAARP